MVAAVWAAVDISIDGATRPSAHGIENRGSSFYVVGIGASAGGLEALEQFFDHVPPDSGMAFVVVQHLSPDFKSLMDEILARRTKLPIRLVEDGVHVQPNNIYLIPPRKQMIIAAGQLLLREKEREHDLSLPIDVFFRSLAQDCGEHGIAVVLSGGGSDGSRGIMAVHEAGGLVVVQDVDSAQFDGMPKTARDAGVANYVLPPDQMPRIIVDHARRTRGARSSSAALEPGGMAAVYRMLEQEFGIDFTHYKPSTVTRRIERRLALARAEHIDGYVERLKAERDELNVLYRDLLIGVTRFFRNEEAFRVLEEQVFPELLSTRDPQATLRLWVAGCATGEEVYSIAIVLHELMQRMGERPVKIFATDVHAASIETATRGLYDAQAVQSVSSERLERYFLPRARGYQVAPEIRQMVVFATHNVIKDAPFTRVDFISCRNMLIYLQAPVQQRVLNLFQFALNRGGTLFLGPSESPGALMTEFETIDKRWRVYKKRGDGARAALRGSLARPLGPAQGAASALPRLTRPPAAPLIGTYDAVLEQFMPPSLLVSERGELMHVFGGADRFLKLRGGRQSLDVLNMVHADLRTVLFGALARAIRQADPIVFRGVRTTDDPDGLHTVTLRRIEGRGAATPNVLVSFEPLKPAAVGEAQTERTLDLGQVSREQLESLEAELTYTKENLQAATEELETSNEELQAANEELLASNEELQSTNEELQSVNEELYSVNAEYQRKIADLTELGNDMENLLSSTEVGTIFLDRELRIRKFTPQIAASFSLLPQDIGRPIAAFSHTIDHPSLLDDLQRVLDTGLPIENEVKHGEDHQSFLRILPYRAKGRIDGVVLTMIDVSGLRAAEDALFHERYLLNSLLATVPDAIYFKDARGKFIRANMAMAKRLGLEDPREAVGKTGFELPRQEVALAVHQQDERVLKSGEAVHYKLEMRASEGQATEWDLVTRLPLRDADEDVVGIIGIFRNVTEQKRAELAIEDGVRRRDQFLAMLSHELRNPLGAIVGATALLQAGRADEVKRKKLLQILERQSQHMARLLDDLLEVSRVTQDKIELVKSTVDLTAVTRDTIDAARATIEERGLTFVVKLETCALYVEGDPARLQQVESNLLHNAAKYTPRGGHVELELRRDGNHAQLSVRDDGMGIQPDMLHKVFDLFVQNERTLDRADGGLGVGLTLVRGLVTKHGGTVEVHSAGEGKGSEFVVRLPLTEAPRGDEQPSELAQTKPTMRKRRVVIIEDNADSRGLLCELLEVAGFSCHTAGDGLSGLALIEEVAPDLAVVDIGLPGIDGLELARRVRASEKHAKLVLLALTGYGQREDRERIYDAGFDRHLVKPVDPALLIRMLEELGEGADPLQP
jgi:two-component system, chemotaxis family, CheB/CheR fusion protein